MKSRPFIALLAVMACSSLPAENDGIVALEVSPTTALSLEKNHTLQLHARALNLAGDSVPGAQVAWRTVDTALIAVDQSGLITALSDSGVARVQASVGSLVSSPISITLVPDTSATTSLRR